MEEKALKKYKGGRKKLAPGQLQNHKLQLHLNNEEYKRYLLEYEASGYKSKSSYLKDRLFNKDKAIAVNPIEFIKALDKIGAELARVGNNINQLARHANVLIKSIGISQATVQEFNLHMSVYNNLKRDTIKAYRAVIRKI